MNSKDFATVADIVGRNAQRLRGDHKIEDVAIQARALGLRWNSGRVSDLERGRISPTLPTLFALANVLSAVTEKQVSVADLVRTREWVAVTDRMVVRGERLATALEGGPTRIEMEDMYVDPHDVAAAIRITRASGLRGAVPLANAVRETTEAEHKIARSLGVSLAQVAQAAMDLWGRSLTAERDDRAGTGASAQKRGRVSRELKAELRARLEHGHD
ncbi:hypothetical protein ACFVKB_05115 [Rhodococcus sp. NPDC127530]|uniref:hypothetical protein n=1 Tax=unclassified Rhodococcus (in: high G+C Gram-positive bacteria) TaxID=192944 RepID=UPI00364308CA